MRNPFSRSPKAQAASVDTISRDTIAKAARQATPQGVTAGSHVRNGIWEQVVDPRVLVLATHNNWMLGTAIDKIIQEATKEGYEWVPKWAARCQACGKVYKDTAPKKCKECGNTEHWAFPDESQLEDIENVFQHPNQDENGDVHKSFMDIVRDCIFYLETVDDYYVEVIRDELGYVVELWPVASEFIRKKADNRYEKNFRERFCPICGEIESGTFARCKDDNGQHPLTIDTDYIQLGGFTNDVVSRWGSASLLHGNARAWGTRVYGVPKLYRVWAATQILRWMELYQWSAYSENKMPDSFVAFPGMKQSEVNDMVEQVVDFKEKNPQIRKDVFLGVQEEPKHVVTMPDFKALMSVEMAGFLREAIAINYGVSLNMLGLQTPGKLGSETETVEVSYDTIDECQSQFNEFVNHKMVAMWPEVQDWEWKLISPKKDDLVRLATLNQTKASTVATLRSSGIDAYLDDEWDIVIRDSPPPQQQQSPAEFGNALTEFGKSITKALSPRGIAPADAVSGIVSIEDDFVKELMEEYTIGIDKIFEVAKSSGASKDTIKDALNIFNDGFIKDAITRAELFATNVYMNGLVEEIKSMGIDRAARFSQIDMNALKVLKEQPKGIFDSIKTFGQEHVDRFREIIDKAYSTPGEFDLNKMIKHMEHATGGNRYMLERIARSETTTISNMGRVKQWEQYADPMTKEYHWVDSTRTKTPACPICKAIAKGGSAVIGKKTYGPFNGNPYSIPELQEITKGYWRGHPLCRCTVVRRPLDKKEEAA